MAMKNPDVTVLVATYNPKPEELNKTLKSIALQENAAIEIVVTDDGSVHFPVEDVERFLRDNDFLDYRLVCNEVNRGTVHNVHAGLLRAKGKYVKLISPGDCLSSPNAIRTLLDHITRCHSDMVFGDVAYFLENTREFTLKKHYAHPQDTVPYLKQRKKSLWYNYLILNDTIHGVSTLLKKDVLLKYIELAMNKVIYTEDTLYRIMVNDGISIAYCPETVVLYSYGSGISTSNNDKWKQRIKKDLQATDRMIVSNIKGARDRLLFDMAVKWRDNRNVIDLVRLTILSPTYFIKKMLGSINKRYTPVEYNEHFYSSCCKSDK